MLVHTNNRVGEFRLAIIGAVGLPASYGGFETLVENLAKYHQTSNSFLSMNVYCSSKSCKSGISNYLSAQLKYIPLKANGVQSIPYDIISLISAIWCRNNIILLLGVSGAIILPFIRLISTTRIVTNIDGMEWRREKWKGVAKYFLRFSEKIAVRYSHQVISDNSVIAEYVKQVYGVDSQVIAYGGDHAVSTVAVPLNDLDLPDNYALTICRIEPENNVHMILEAFSRLTLYSLVIVGNWNNSEYGKGIRNRFSIFTNITMLDPIYDLGKLKTLRLNANFYVHGHSAGGTNPSLVEAMHFGNAVLAFDCNFNRSTTEGRALFFKTTGDLLDILKNINMDEAKIIGNNMLEIAKHRYTWKVVAQQYFNLLVGAKLSISSEI